MMTVPRFEKKYIKVIPQEIKIHSEKTILIKDHKSDKVIGLINLEDVKKDNEYLADRIIELIEEFIDE